MYGWSKLYCEQLVKTFCIQHNFCWEILRLGHVFGEGEEKFQKVIPTMIKKALAGDDITIYGDGEALRTFIYVRDVAKAIASSIKRDESDIINVVGSEPISINNLAEIILKMSDSKATITHIPSENKNRNLCFDNSKLKATLLEAVTSLDVGLENEMIYMKRKAL